MPALELPMKPLADQTFIAQGKRLPLNWKQPQGLSAKRFQMAFRKGGHESSVDPSCYFRPASSNRLHAKQCEQVGERFKRFVHHMLDGFKQAHDQWRQAASFLPMPIAGPVVTGPPKSLQGPMIEPLIKQLSIPQPTPQERVWRDAVAAGLAQGFHMWESGVTVPGLPWYPLFAACPTPVAPPTPNVPMPLTLCTSAGRSSMTAKPLEQLMVAAFGGGGPDGQFQAIAVSVAEAVSVSFESWLATQNVVGVVGTGAAAIFPGPVVGVTLPATGMLAV